MLHLVYTFAGYKEMVSSSTHTDILRQLSVPTALANQCSVTARFSDSTIFIKFPTNVLMQTLHNYLSWDVGFYVGSKEDIEEALKHGELLQSEDINASGQKRSDEAREKRWFGGSAGVCVFTNFHQAWIKSSYNLGQRISVILAVKLRPGAFESAGPRKSTTRRRASHILYGLMVNFTSNCDDHSLDLCGESPPRDISPPRCRYAVSCFEYLQSLRWPLNMFDPAGYRCYCRDCYLDSWPKSMDVAGETYIIPKGWCRFGLFTPPVLAGYNNIWDDWANAFHGTTPRNALSIIQHGQLLINGDTTLQGDVVRTRASMDKAQNRYFLSPHICYAAHPWYAEINKFRKEQGRQLYGQVVFAMKVRLGIYGKQRETEGGAKEIFDDYTVIPKNEIEWYSACRGSVVPYGVLFRVFGDAEKREIERLAWNRSSGN